MPTPRVQPKPLPKPKKPLKGTQMKPNPQAPVPPGWDTPGKPMKQVAPPPKMKAVLPPPPVTKIVFEPGSTVYGSRGPVRGATQSGIPITSFVPGVASFLRPRVGSASAARMSLRASNGATRPSAGGRGKSHEERFRRVNIVRIGSSGTTRSGLSREMITDIAREGRRRAKRSLDEQNRQARRRAKWNHRLRIRSVAHVPGPPWASRPVRVMPQRIWRPLPETIRNEPARREPDGSKLVGPRWQAVGPSGLVAVSGSGARVQYNAEGLQPRVKWLADLVNANFPGVTAIGGYNDRDVRGRPGTKSMHAFGRAIDVFVAFQQHGDAIVSFVVANAEYLGVGRVIWQRLSWTSRDGWIEYHGSSPHTNHVHIEY